MSLLHVLTVHSPGVITLPDGGFGYVYQCPVLM